jgi:hypothetical protein
MLDQIAAAGARHIIGKFKPVDLRQIHTAGNKPRMHNARDNGRTRADTSTIPSRRRLFAGLSATLLASAAIATAARGAPVAALPAGDDAELLRLCSGFLAEDRVIKAWNAGNVPEEVGEAANSRWWEYIRQIDGIPAMTPDGLRAKAECALLAPDGVADPECDADELARSVLAEVAEWGAAA